MVVAGSLHALEPLRGRFWCRFPLDCDLPFLGPFPNSGDHSVDFPDGGNLSSGCPDLLCPHHAYGSDGAVALLLCGTL